MLAVRYDCPLVLADFLITSDNDGVEVQSVASLEFVELQPEDRLMIVTCDYQLAEKREALSDIKSLFILAADSLSFHLIARV